MTIPYPWNLVFAWTATPAACIFPVAYLYSLGLMRGIACARDEQHRMTPLSPWFYFWMKAKRPLILTACLALPVLGFALVCLFVAWSGDMTDMTWSEIADLLDQLRTSPPDRQLAQLFLSGFFGLECIIFAFITRMAPKFSSPLLLTALGVGLGGCAWFTLIAVLTYQDPGAEWARGLIMLFTLSSILSLILTWLHVRFRLNRAWFRLDDS